MTREAGLIFCGPVEVLLLVLCLQIKSMYDSVTMCSGLRGPTILCGRGLHYAHGFVLDPNLDIFWDQRDKVGTLFGNSVNLDLLSF